MIVKKDKIIFLLKKLFLTLKKQVDYFVMFPKLYSSQLLNKLFFLPHKPINLNNYDIQGPSWS